MQQSTQQIQKQRPARQYCLKRRHIYSIRAPNPWTYLYYSSKDRKRPVHNPDSIDGYRWLAGSPPSSLDIKVVFASLPEIWTIVDRYKQIERLRKHEYEAEVVL